MSEALRLAGGIVTGIDFSSMAIDLARKSFPNVDFRCLSFPDELEKSDQFDIVWSVDLTIINTFDVDQIYRNLIEPCLLLLQPNGVLIIGWHTDFSGRMKSGTACWSLQTINDLKLYAGLSAPRVVDVRFSLLSKLIIIASRFFRRSIPVFFVRNRDKIQA
jgi:SAM-dependent methyltransferase